jgi:chitodextrinase
VFEGAQLLATTTTSKYTVIGLTPNTAYQFSVKAFDNAGNVSAATAPISVTTQAVTPCFSAPATPSALSATSVLSSSVTLAWTAPAMPANCTDSFSISVNGVASATGVTGAGYTVTGLSPSTTYQIAVAAVDSIGASVPATISVTTPASVPVLTGNWPAHVFAPYIDLTAWPTPMLTSIYTASGSPYFTLAFMVSQSGCQASWGGVIPLSQNFETGDIAALRQAGGDVILSFGGENGVELAQACSSVASLQAQYQAAIDLYSITRIDFDIEGGAVADPASIDLRNKAIAGLQAAARQKGAPLIVQFTLPVLPTGLTQDGVNLVANALKNGVDIGVLNVMAMDYGAVANPSTMGANAVAAVNATEAQLATLDGSSKTTAQLFAMMGVTPMIGMNDVSPEVFTLGDAASTLAAAQSEGIGLIAMWSMGRDVQCPGSNYVASNCSGVAQSPYAFSSILKAFNRP